MTAGTREELGVKIREAAPRPLSASTPLPISGRDLPQSARAAASILISLFHDQQRTRTLRLLTVRTNSNGAERQTLHLYQAAVSYDSCQERDCSTLDYHRLDVEFNCSAYSVNIDLGHVSLVSADELCIQGALGPRDAPTNGPSAGTHGSLSRSRRCICKRSTHPRNER